MNGPIYGCDGCATTAGRMGCMFHREPIIVSQGGIPYNHAEIERLKTECARLEGIVLDQQARMKRLETANDRLTVEHAERGKVNADLNKRLQRAERAAHATPSNVGRAQ